MEFMSEIMEIYSYIGAGRLKFGMHFTEVGNFVGPPVKSNTGFLGELTEYRENSGLVTTYKKTEATLVEIGFSKNISNLEFGGQKLFKDHQLQVLSKLVQQDGSAFEYLGFIILIKLGITLTGFHDNADEQKAVTVFDKGRWDEEIPSMKKFHYVYKNPNA
jgi:hypothetical protein